MKYSKILLQFTALAAISEGRDGLSDRPLTAGSRLAAARRMIELTPHVAAWGQKHRDLVLSLGTKQEDGSFKVDENGPNAETFASAIRELNDTDVECNDEKCLFSHEIADLPIKGIVLLIEAGLVK